MYLLIDRASCETVVHTEPEGGKYRSIRSDAFGATVVIPGLGITWRPRSSSSASADPHPAHGHIRQ
ncbi:hypothetical protein [Streptacidiphilus cavernicola]|uniref:Uncharacterized protein n=1 Tax=Streptacidiphilus cavernicola TaxID=3342716 RepID=A0ABV6W2F3_9ACTN